MKRNKVLDKIKKIIICIVCSITLIFSMPVQSDADIIESFGNVLLHIPDAVMYIINQFIGQVGEEELTGWIMDYKGSGEGVNLRLLNFDVTPYTIFTSRFRQRRQ